MARRKAATASPCPVMTSYLNLKCQLHVSNHQGERQGRQLGRYLQQSRLLLLLCLPPVSAAFLALVADVMRRPPSKPCPRLGAAEDHQTDGGQ